LLSVVTVVCACGQRR